MYGVWHLRRLLGAALAAAAVCVLLWRWDSAPVMAQPQLTVMVEQPPQPMPPNTVYLTFDDGPSHNTELLLQVLKEEGVTATFFVTGQEERSDLYQRIVQEGHSIGLHSYSHEYDRIYRSTDSFLEDLARLDALLYDCTGLHPKILRFPGGSRNRNAGSTLPQIIDEMTRRGYLYYDWNVVSGDDTATVYPAEVLLQNVITGSAELENPVVLFHDAPLCTTTPEAVRQVIAYFRQKGYAFAPLDETVEPLQFRWH